MFVALKSFTASHPKQLSFDAGDRLTVVTFESKARGYVVAHHAESDASHAGFVPFNHLVCVEPREDEEAFVALAKVRVSFAHVNSALLCVRAGETVHLLKEVTDFPGWAEASVDGRRGLVPLVCLEPPMPLIDSYVSFALLLVSDEALIRALGCVVKPTSAEKVGKALLEVFAHDEMRLLRMCVESEVAFTTTEGTLFRRNSINSTILGDYGRRVGGEYLRQMVQPTMDKVGLGTEGYEIDPTKLSGTETVKGNAANVIARVEELLSRLVASVDKLPREIAHVCWLLSENVCAKMPAAKYVGIGGFLMLRFILPVLAAGIPGAASVPVERRRGLVLISKAMINLVNDVEFGKKEPFMAVLEEPLRKHGIAKLQQFLDRAAQLGATFNPPSVVATTPLALVAAEAHQEALARLRIACIECASDIAKIDAAMAKRLERAVAQCPNGTAMKESSVHEFADLEKKYPEFVGDKRVLQDKISALNKAKDHEVALQRLVPVVSSSKEKKQVVDELALASEEVKSLETALQEFLEMNTQVNLMESRF